MLNTAKPCAERTRKSQLYGCALSAVVPSVHGFIFSVYEVVCVACQSRSQQSSYATDKRRPPLLFHCSTLIVPPSLFHFDCSTIAVPPSLFNYHCSTITIPPSLFYHHCSTITVPPSLVYFNCSTTRAPPSLFHHYCSTLLFHH